MDHYDGYVRQDCGGHWEGNDWVGCGNCERCIDIEDADQERAECDVPL